MLILVSSCLFLLSGCFFIASSGSIRFDNDPDSIIEMHAARALQESGVGYGSN